MFVLALAACLMPLVARAETCPLLPLTGPIRGDGLAGHIAAFVDDSRDLTIRDITASPDRFRLLPGALPDFGYTDARLWLRLCVANATSAPTDWRLVALENFFPEYAVYVLRSDGRLDTPVRLGPGARFGDRPVDHPQLVAPIQLAPGETATVFIAYASGGSSSIDLAVETHASLDRLTMRTAARNFLFYGMMTLLIAVAAGALVVVRHRIFAAYCAYAASALLFVMHEDGIAFKYLWPDAPGFNANATIFAGTCLIVSGAIYARIFLRTRRRHPWIDTLLLAIVVGTLAMDAGLWFVDMQLLKQLLVLTSLLSFVTFTLAGLVSYVSGHREVRFYLVAWVGVMVSSTLMNLRDLFGVEIAQSTVHDSMRLVMVLDALMMGLAIADRYNQLRLSRQRALRRTLEAARRRLVLSQRLDDLQTRHDLAIELAKSRDERVQNMVHDLRQPLHALRLSVQALGRDQDTAKAPAVETAFSYLEDLVSDALNDMPPAPDDTAVGVQQVIAAIAEMFAPDARAKALRLRHVPSGAEAPADPLALTRILSNLVANAIAYTARGGVLIGTRRRGDTLRIEIHDSGPGLSATEFDRASRRHARLAPDTAPAGSGLGLSIALDLAARHGWRLERLATRRQGTGLALVIPLARSPRP